MDQRAEIRKLEALLPDAMHADAAWARHVLGGAKKRLRAGKKAGDLLKTVSERLERSVQTCKRRQASLPDPEYDEALPITAHREEIIAAIRDNPVVIVAGETGSGKTTQLPKFCLEAGRGTRGFIGCTQPRRIAARAMAERVSEELGTRLGDTVGYQVRFRATVRESSLVKFMTDGILLAETQNDRSLAAYDTLIIDEAHERSLNIDFLLGYVRQLIERRPDLRVVITSATIDTGKFAAHFCNAPVIEVSGRGYPVEVVYQPVDDESGEETSGRDLYRGISDAVKRVSRTDARGDMLVFLSGEREIREAADYLSRQGLRHTEILPLYARLSAAEQHRVFHPGPARRIILSTNIAETSLTVPRIRFVIDTGLARISRYAHRSRIQRLPIEPISQASANQRAGRCGRLGPGICVRLYSEEDFESRPEFTEPEILRTSLASVILRMLTMGLGSVADFPFIDAPAPRMINDAYNLLFELEAIDADRQATPLGYQLSRWPIDVRLARMVLAGAELGCTGDLLVLAAGLSIQDPRERPIDAREQADEAHQRFVDTKSDFMTLLELWRYLRKQHRAHSGNQFRKLCRREFLNWQRVLEWFDLFQQLRDQAREEGLPLAAGHGDYDTVHMALLSGLLSHVGQKHPEHPEYTGVRNRQFSIFPGSGLFGRSPAWLMSAEVVETSRPYARTNAVIKSEWIEKRGAHLLKAHHFDPHWSERRGHVMAWQQLSLYGLVLVERRPVSYSGVDPQDCRKIFIREALVPGKLRNKPAFILHNIEAREQVLALENKRRRRDVLVDEAAQAAWYEERIPENVLSEPSLEKWLARSGDRRGSSLLMTAGDLVLDTAGEVSERDYPDFLVSGDGRFAIHYRFQPGAPDDGATLEVPLELLNQLSPEQLDWLVPGYRLDKAESLIRSLPKPLRRVMTPVPGFARRALKEISESDDVSFSAALAGALRHLSGLDVNQSDFDPAQVPEYLNFRIVLLDESGKELASGRDFAAIQQRFGTRARRRFMDRQGRDWNRDGCMEWDFGDLPGRCRTGGGATAYPALVDQHDTVGLRLFDTPGDAAIAHVEGVRRLLGIQLRDKMTWLRKNHGLKQAALAAWTARGSAQQLVEDLAWSSLAALADQEAPGIRTPGAFDDLLARIRQALGREFQSRAAILSDVLSRLAEVAPAVQRLGKSHARAADDMSGQADDLLYEGFLLELDPDRFKHYARYLESILLRIKRLEEDPGRDAALMQRLGDYWQRYMDRLAQGFDYDEALDEYRWLCHEFRVSLFTQSLGTAQKVSPKRLEQAWKAVTGAS